ncbi:hypothetical protein C0991_007277 [Blastosporella zonata]|nr:hypothetical protein C0991_007277 [Blastosporella zonata]
MFKKSLTLTLLVFTVLVNAHPEHNVNLKRLIKKRAPSPQDGPSVLVPVAGAGATVPTFPSTSSTSSPSTTSPVTSLSQSSATLDPSTSLSDSLSASSSTSASLSESSSSASSSSSTVSTTSTSTSTSSTPTSAAVATTPTAEQPAAVTTPATTTVSKPIVTLTQSVNPSQSATSIPEQAAAAAKPKSTTITVLIVVASSVAALAILWTVFRKWKFGRSTKLDERLQPIDWRPTNDDDEALPGHHRRHSGASSFHSASHPSTHGHGSSDIGHNSPSSYAIPDHDFTAGPANLAPIGGYADLARGPSPQPQMNQAGSAMLTRSAYDVGVPLHHQGYDSYEYARR